MTVVDLSKDQPRAVPSGGAVVLQADGVVMQFGGLMAVNNVDMVVREGEIVGLIGPNGAGKTTSSTAHRDVPPDPWHGALMPCCARRAGRGLMRVPGNDRLFGNMTALENVMVGGRHPHEFDGVDSIVRGPKFRRASRNPGSIPGVAGLRRAGAPPALARNMPYGDQRRPRSLTQHRPHAHPPDEPTVE